MHAPSLLALAPSLLALVTIVPLAPLGLTAPVANPVLATRKEFCANAPDTVAGTFLAGRDIEPGNLTSNSHAFDDTTTKDLTSRVLTSKGTLWCAPGSETYVLINIASAIPPDDFMRPLVETVLANAAQVIFDHILAVGDGNIFGGKFQWPEGEFSPSQPVFLKVWNANNHQVTWGVMHASIAALVNYMSKHGWGLGWFNIYDGGVQVGYGLFT